MSKSEPQLPSATPLCLPERVLAQHLGVLGKTGSGKSSALRHMVEHLLAQQKRVCIIDPKGDWWGLKVAADGRGPGFPVIAFGDFKEPSATDVPINDRSGAHVAELIAGGNRPAILGFRGWTTGAMIRFYIEFASTLFAKNAGELYLVGDEFHNFAPKGKILDPQAGQSLHWSNRLLSEGRGLGIICLIASQRPQKVHNDTLTSLETLVAMRVIHKADRDAVKDWIDGAGDPKKGTEVLNALAGMPRGEAYVWSPEIGFGPERVTFPLFVTFDSFAPPQLQKKVNRAGWAEVDLDAVKQQLATVIEEAKANDPAELKKQIADLRKELAAKPTEAPIVTAKPPRVVDRPVVTDKQIAGLERAALQAEKTLERVEADRDRLAKTFDATLAIVQTLRGDVDLIRAAIAEARRLNTTAVDGVVSASVEKRVAATPHNPLPDWYAGRPEEQQQTPRVDAGLSGTQQRMLDAAATLTTLGVEVSRETVSAWIGVHPRGGSVGENLASLAKAGLITVDRGQIVVTPAGHAAAEPSDPTQAIERAKAGLSPRQTKIFDLVAAAWPGETTRDAVATAMNIHPRGGSLGEDIARLAGRGLITSSRGTLQARDFLFAEGRA